MIEQFVVNVAFFVMVAFCIVITQALKINALYMLNLIC